MKNFSATSILYSFLAAILLLHLPQKLAAQGCAIPCNDLITVGIPPSGTLEFLPEMLADGDLSQTCPNGVFVAQVQINGVWQNPSSNFVFDNSHIGNTYFSRVRDVTSGSMCWGNVQVVEALPDTLRFKLCSEFWRDNRPVKGTILQLQPTNPSFPYSPMIFVLDSTQHCADVTIYPGDYLAGTTFSYTIFDGPFLGADPVNGVTPLDLCVISRHILGVEPLPSPYAHFAADANKSNSVTTFDMVELRKLIIGVYTELPNNTSWRWISDYCDFPNPNNPFQLNCTTAINLTELEALHGDTARVYVIKVGDVDGDAALNGDEYFPPNAADSITLLLPMGTVSPGTPIVLPVKFDKTFSASSIMLNFYLDPALGQFDSISSGVLTVSPTMVNYTPANGQISFLDIAASPVFVPAGEALFFLHLKANQVGKIEELFVFKTDVANMLSSTSCTNQFNIGSANSGNVPVFTPASASWRFTSPSPNPYSDEAVMELALENPETVVLEVYDLAGRVVFSIEKNLPAGNSRLGIPADVLPLHSVGIWRLRSGRHMASGKLLRQ